MGRLSGNLITKATRNITVLKKTESEEKSWKFPSRCATRKENSISHRLPPAFKGEYLMKLLIVPLFIFYFFLPFLHTARRSRPLRFHHLDSRRARLRAMGWYSGHPLVLHRSLHSSRHVGAGTHNELFRLLFGVNGTWRGTAYCKYFSRHYFPL